MRYVVHLLVTLVFCLGLAGGIAAQRWLDQSPAFDYLIPAPWRYPLPPALKHVRWSGGWAVRLAAANQATATQTGLVTQCRAFVDLQTKAAALLHAQSERQLADARHDLAMSRGEVDLLRRGSQDLKFYRPPEENTCSAWEAVDRHVMTVLRGG
jgi:hypothetical protein